MSSTPHHVSSSSIHQHANFPPNLEIKSCRLDQESRTPEINSDKLSSQRKEEALLEDVRLFGIAAKTWDASFRLLDYLVGRPACSSDSHSKPDDNPYQFQPVSPLLIPSPTSNTPRQTIVLDLGSGTCHLPIGLARAFSESREYSNQRFEIIATDLKDVLPLLERNTSRENLAENVKLSARQLTWGNPEKSIELINSFELDTCHLKDTVNEEIQFIITCSDLIFFPWLFAPLIRTLLLLTSPPNFYPPTAHKALLSHCLLPSATVFIGYKQRSEFLEFPFFPLLGRYFKLERIISSQDFTEAKKEEKEEEEEEIIHLLKATRHPSTLDLDLTLVFDDDDPSGPNTSSLSKHGLSQGADQWELLILSNLSF